MLSPRETFDSVLSPVKLGLLLFENQLSFSQTLPPKLARTSRQLSIGLFSMGLAHVYAIQVLCKTIYQASFFLFVWVNFV